MFDLEAISILEKIRARLAHYGVVSNREHEASDAVTAIQMSQRGLYAWAKLVDECKMIGSDQIPVSLIQKYYKQVLEIEPKEYYVAEIVLRDGTTSKCSCKSTFEQSQKDLKWLLHRYEDFDIISASVSVTYIDIEKKEVKEEKEESAPTDARKAHRSRKVLVKRAFPTEKSIRRRIRIFHRKHK